MRQGAQYERRRYGKCFLSDVDFFCLSLLNLSLGQPDDGLQRSLSGGA